MVGERIEVLDGSRRRAACIFNETKFEILVTKDEISLADARQLAIDIQTAREHTLRELGKRFEVMYGKSMTKEEIARAENISKAKVTRAFQAAAVPDEMIAVFPVASDLALQITSYCSRSPRMPTLKACLLKSWLIRCANELQRLRARKRIKRRYWLSSKRKAKA